MNSSCWLAAGFGSTFQWQIGPLHVTTKRENEQTKRVVFHSFLWSLNTWINLFIYLFIIILYTSNYAYVWNWIDMSYIFFFCVFRWAFHYLICYNWLVIGPYTTDLNEIDYKLISSAKFWICSTTCYITKFTCLGMQVLHVYSISQTCGMVNKYIYTNNAIYKDFQ